MFIVTQRDLTLVLHELKHQKITKEKKYRTEKKILKDPDVINDITS